MSVNNVTIVSRATVPDSPSFPNVKLFALAGAVLGLLCSAIYLIVYVGTFGKRVEDFSRQLIEAGQGYVFASDAHDLPGRKYEMRQAFEKMQHEFGQELVEQYQENARSIINGGNVSINEIKKLKKKKRFWLF